MRTIPIPTNVAGNELDIKEILSACISNYRNKDLKKRLSDCKTILQEAADDFPAAVRDRRLHSITQDDMVGPSVTGEEMESVYTNKMAMQGQPGRTFYDVIKAVAPRGVCPFCGQRTVSTLDHFLPKSDYPIYSIIPANLVPSCADCNKIKMTTNPTSAEDQLFHPYYDDIQTETWLVAEVIENNGVGVSFKAEPPATLGRVLCRRIAHNFDTLELAALYAAHAGEELAGASQQLKNVHRLAGVAGLIAHVEEAAASRRSFFRNSWQTAFYEALATDDWFHNVGITQI